MKLLFTFHDFNLKQFLSVFMEESIYTTRLEVRGTQNNTSVTLFSMEEQKAPCNYYKRKN